MKTHETCIILSAIYIAPTLNEAFGTVLGAVFGIAGLGFMLIGRGKG